MLCGGLLHYHRLSGGAAPGKRRSFRFCGRLQLRPQCKLGFVTLWRNWLQANGSERTGVTILQLIKDGVQYCTGRSKDTDMPVSDCCHAEYGRSDQLEFLLKKQPPFT